MVRGQRLVLVADTWPGFCVAFFGAQYAGALPVPVSVPVGLGAKASYIEQLHRQIVAAEARSASWCPTISPPMPAAARGTTAALLAGTMCALRGPARGRRSSCGRFRRGEQCYVQFSSGSTRLPIGVDVRQDQLMANIDGSHHAPGASTKTISAVSWLPLYHDMGLIGFVLALLCAADAASISWRRAILRAGRCSGCR